MVPFDLVRHDIGHLVRAHLGDAGVVLYLAGKPLGAAVCLGVDGKLSAVRQMDQESQVSLRGHISYFRPRPAAASAIASSSFPGEEM